MNLKDVDNPDFIPTDPSYRTYLSLASQCHLLSVEWQRRGAAWEQVAKDVMKKAAQDKSENNIPLEYE